MYLIIWVILIVIGKYIFKILMSVVLLIVFGIYFINGLMKMDVFLF